MKALENYKVSKDCVLVYINLYKYSHRNGWDFLFTGLFVFPKSKPNTIYSFKWVLNGEV